MTEPLVLITVQARDLPADQAGPGSTTALTCSSCQEAVWAGPHALQLAAAGAFASVLCTRCVIADANIPAHMTPEQRIAIERWRRDHEPPNQ